MWKVLSLIVSAFMIGLLIGLSIQRDKYSRALWDECMILKKSSSPVKRYDDLWLAYQGAVNEYNCANLFRKDFCTIEKFE